MNLEEIRDDALNMYQKFVENANKEIGKKFKYKIS